MRLYLKVISTFMLMTVLLATCQKAETKKSYQDHIALVSEALLAKHSLVQLTLTYIKGINDSVLLSDRYNHFHETHFYLTNAGNDHNLELKYFGNRDFYERYRDRSINVCIKGELNTDGSKAEFHFTNFYYDSVAKPLTTAVFILEQTGRQNDQLVYNLSVQNFVFHPDTLRSIAASADYSIKWINADGSGYYHPADQFEITGGTDIISSSGEEVKLGITRTTVMAPDCIYFKDGEMDIGFSTNEPNRASLTFRTHAACDQLADLEMDDIRFVLDMVYPKSKQ